MTQFSMLYDNNGLPIPLKVVFSAKRKRSIGMTITASGVTVRAPKHCSKSLIQQFIDTKYQWIVKKWGEQQKQSAITTIEYDDNGVPLAVQHLGKQLPVYMRAHDKKRPVVKYMHDCLTIILPVDRLNALPQYTEYMQRVLEKWQRSYAVDYLTQRTYCLNQELGLNVGAVIVKSYKRKYGQCKGRDISLDWKLIRFPVAISDHVIYHELAHLTHKHHQKTFRELLAVYDPKTEDHKHWLKKNGPAMHSDR